MNEPDLTGIPADLIEKVRAKMPAPSTDIPVFEPTDDGLMTPEEYAVHWQQRLARARTLRSMGLDPRDHIDSEPEPKRYIPGTVGTVRRR